ncbi:MAG: GDSL-type esterase/lipase family protein [Myxococcota bacterium]
MPAKTRKPSPEARAALDTAEALRHVGVVVATILGMLVLTYVVPAFQRFRPWQPGDAVPLSSLFTPAEALYAFAGTGSPGGEGNGEELGAAVQQALGDGQEDAPAVGPLVEIPASVYAGIETHLEDEVGGLGPFYEALLATARREPGAITRVAHYGDSSIATDLWTSTMRERLQRRFGDAGHGFVLLAKGYMPYRHRGIETDASDDWALREIVRNHDPRDQRYGYGGVQYRGRPGSWARFSTAERGDLGTAASRFELWYQTYGRGGLVKIEVDGEEARVVDTRAPETADGSPPPLGDGVEVVEVEDGAHTFEVRFGGRGQPRLYGVVLEREGPGVVYDSLGLVGARAPRLLNYEPGHIAWQIAKRDVDLLVLGFGGNEASDGLTAERYEADYRRVIRRMRAGRADLGCLIVAPLDQATRDERGRVVTLPNVPLIVDAQRRAAADAGCAFFDTWSAMGGEGSMGRWLRASPRLAMGDLRHATPAGYAVVGNLLFEALMEGFASYLAGLPEEARAIATPPSTSAP